MNVAYINPFLASTVSVFDTMLNCKLQRGAPYLKNCVQPQHEVSGVIGLSGKAQGTVVVSLSRETALNVAEALLQERPAELNRDVTDAIGEIVNMIAGGGKGALEQLELSMSLPTVITGKGHCIDFPRKVTPVCIPFSSDWGEISVEVGLCDTPAG
jgi:chemotaxis protein CheX